MSKKKDYQKEWQKNNKEKVSLYAKKWIEANKEKRQSIVLSWRARNPYKVKEMNKKSGRKWAQKNKGKRNAIKMKRIATLKQSTPAWADIEKIKDVYVEAARLTKETGVPYEVDHILPLQGINSCGLHVHYNLQILTRSVNRSKGNKIIQQQ